MDRDYDVITLYINYTFIIRRPGVAIFADIIKIITIIINFFLNTQEKLIELKIMYQNANYISIS